MKTAPPGYELLAALGEGATSVVYRARRGSDYFAVKFLSDARGRRW